MCASVGLGSRVVNVTIPTVEIIGLSEEVPVKVQPPVPEPNGVTTPPPLPFRPPVAPPPVPPEPLDPLLEPQPSPTHNRAPHQTRANEPLFICSSGRGCYGSVSPSSTSPSLETRSTCALSGATETRAYPESGQ